MWIMKKLGRFVPFSAADQKRAAANLSAANIEKLGVMVEQAKSGLGELAKVWGQFDARDRASRSVIRRS